MIYKRLILILFLSFLYGLAHAQVSAHIPNSTCANDPSGGSITNNTGTGIMIPFATGAGEWASYAALHTVNTTRNNVYRSSCVCLYGYSCNYDTSGSGISSQGSAWCTLTSCWFGQNYNSQYLIGSYCYDGDQGGSPGVCDDNADLHMVTCGANVQGTNDCSGTCNADTQIYGCCFPHDGGPDYCPYHGL